MPNQIDTTSEFDDWLDGVKDPIGKGAVTARLARAENGSFGDIESVGDGVSEMRVFVGPGYNGLNPLPDALR